MRNRWIEVKVWYELIVQRTGELLDTDISQPLPIDNNTPTTITENNTKHAIPTNNCLSNIINMNWWDTPEAWQYFGYLHPRNEEERGESVKQIVLVQMKKFRKGFLTSSGWRGVVKDSDIHNKASAAFIFQIKCCCKYIYDALSIALIKKRQP